MTCPLSKSRSVVESELDPGSPDYTPLLVALSDIKSKVIYSLIFWIERIPVLKIGKSGCTSLFSLNALALSRTTHLFVPVFKIQNFLLSPVFH